MVQVAEGGLSEVSNIFLCESSEFKLLQTLSEVEELLSIKSSAVKSEVQRIAESAHMEIQNY